MCFLKALHYKDNENWVEPSISKKYILSILSSMHSCPGLCLPPLIQFQQMVLYQKRIFLLFNKNFFINLIPQFFFLFGEETHLKVACDKAAQFLSFNNLKSGPVSKLHSLWG